MSLVLDAEDADARQGFVRYSAEQHNTWSVVRARLKPLHDTHACAAYLDGRERLGLRDDRIPQLPDLSDALERQCGYVVRPTPGLTEARAFLRSLGSGVMLSTTYIRDGANPEYTPAPDIVHEVLGHVPMLFDPDLRALLALFGDAAEHANEAQMTLLERLYWFTIEYGGLDEGGRTKAWGAGLLSSFGELRNAFSGGARWLSFDAAEAAATSYDHTHMQPVLFVTPALGALRKDVARFFESDAYRNG